MADRLHSKALQRILQSVRGAAGELISNPSDLKTFTRRLDRFGPDAYTLLCELYGDDDDCETSIEAIMLAALDGYIKRPADLKILDAERADNPRWYQNHTMVGGVCYVDLFAETLQGLKEQIPYFSEIGLTYLHLMPPYRTPEGPDDGGYAVSSYRQIDEALGSIDDLRELAIALRENGISMALDIVFNHTANDHEWAMKARAGDPEYQAYYFMFDSRDMPDAYEDTLREIFPDEHPGAFTFCQDVNKWVWTTFHTYQWDLNYRNPVVFRRMLEEMLFLANVGADVIRLDAVPFVWKEMGTPCENLPQVHTIIRAFNALVRIAAPGIIFKSEAIVHPDDVASYFGSGGWAGRECEISYNPLLMVQLWESLATGHTHLLTYAMQHRFGIPENCMWVNYVRSHDDIGWGFADEDAEALGIHGFYHRQYLNRFYTSEEPNSFAVGYPFQFNEKTLDMRISGTTASLAGLEQALANNNHQQVELAIRRILLIYGVVMSMGGMPLIYLGDEVGTLNDYSYKEDPRKADDSRWVHRPYTDWERYNRRSDASTVEGRIFQTLTRMISIRKRQPAFGAACDTEIIHTQNQHLYAFARRRNGQGVLVVGNFTDEVQRAQTDQLPLIARGAVHDLLTGRSIEVEDMLTLDAYELLWIALP